MARGGGGRGRCKVGCVGIQRIYAGLSADSHALGRASEDDAILRMSSSGPGRASLVELVS